eukprot:CAMPEP_0174725186 /NCGR_PEP_ID=MMETSP1094-20130205/44972_1 /TAXON_ID=156173 /ORGANISM="Chrysochromulina brevifilum, Strain UTEX LB 985" /LENGTH=201 /DNA_ID=CAMNT_0015926543 /DNA_START=18 /DNA_END=619 /DNA_ORIENTATION=-
MRSGRRRVVAAELGYWVLAPYLPHATAEALGDWQEFGSKSAGMPFALKIQMVDDERKAAGMPTIAEERGAKCEDAAILAVVDAKRVHLGLTPITQMRKEGTEPETLLLQQKADVLVALAAQSRPLPYVSTALAELQERHVSYAICTASSAHRVTTCLEAMPQLGSLLPPSLLNSGESDFSPPAHKPLPWVYLQGAMMLGVR